MIVWLFNCVDFFVGKYGIYHACDVLLEKIGCQGAVSFINKNVVHQFVQVNYFFNIFTAGIHGFRNIPVSGFNFMTPPPVEPMLERKHQRWQHILRANFPCNVEISKNVSWLGTRVMNLQ